MKSLIGARKTADRIVQAIWEPPTSGWRGLAGLAVRIGVLLAVYLLLDRWLWRVTLLPEAAYYRPIIVASWLRSLGVLQLLLIVGATGLLGYAGRSRVWKGWAALEDGGTVRLFVGLVAGLLAWWFATLDANLYFAQEYLLDRLLLVLGTLLLIWKPIFVLPFLFVLLPFDAQFHYPLGGHSQAQISLPAHVLLLFVPAHLAWVLTGRRTMASFVFLVLCLIGASYFVPGIGKLQLGWLGHRHVYLGVFTSYSVGWLGFLDPAQIAALARVMAFFDWPVVISTLVIECGALALIWRRKSAMGWLAGFVALHTAIWLTSGILFWTWIAISGTLLLLLWRRGELPIFQVFGRYHFLLSLPIILAGSFIFRPVRLAWLDAPINYTYQLEGVTGAGGRFLVSTAMLAPYDTHFALSSFGRLVDSPQLGIVWGAVHDNETAAALLETSTAAGVFALERESGVNAYDSAAAARFDGFVRAVVDQGNRGRRVRTPFSLLKAPRQVWTCHPDAARSWTTQEVVTSVAVYQVLTFYDGERYRVIRRDLVREIPIEPS